MLRRTFMGLLVITVLGVSSARGAEDQILTGKPNRQAHEIVGYVFDLSEPNWIILGDEVGVAVDKNTSYAFQTPKGWKKASPADIQVGTHVRITLGQDGGWPLGWASWSRGKGRLELPP